MFFETLQQLDLDKSEIEMYVQLLKIGASRASVLAYQKHLPRTTVQNILNRLEQKGIVIKSLENTAHVFTPVHPENLVLMAEMKKRQTMKQYNDLAEELTKITPQLVQMMQGYSNIPKVHFYKGRDAARKILFDTLTSKTELKDYANIDAMFKHVKDINDEYVEEREKTTITKRSLLLDTPFARGVYESGTYSTKSHKGYKWIKSEFYPFSLEMNIYDGKVSYITYVENNFVGVIIENPHIYEMHNSMWNLVWDVLPAV